MLHVPNMTTFVAPEPKRPMTVAELEIEIQYKEKQLQKLERAINKLSAVVEKKRKRIPHLLNMRRVACKWKETTTAESAKTLHYAPLSWDPDMAIGRKPPVLYQSASDCI